MKVSVSTALQLLREADPARAVPPTEPAAAEEALVAVRARAAAGTFAARTGRRFGARLQIALTGVAVATVVGLVAWMIGAPHGTADRSAPGSSATPSATGSRNPPSGPAAADPSFGPTGTLGTSEDPSFARTLHLVEGTLAAVPTLPHAVRAVTAPAARLTTPPLYPMDGNLIDRATFWTAPMTMAQGIAYYRANPPTGMTLSTTWGSAGTQELGMGIAFAPPGDDPDSLAVQISVVTLGTGIALRIDVFAIWIPTKPASEHIGPVDSVDVTVSRDSNPAAPTVHRTLTGAAAQRLADAVDALPVETQSVRSCPVMRAGFVDKLVFHATGRTIDVVNVVGGCGGVSVTVDGAAQPPLSGSVDAEVTAELELPPNYGS